MSEILWPYEETRFEFPDHNTVRLKTPWKSIELKITTDTKVELETLVLRRDEIPAANQRAYFSKYFASIGHEPFFYLVARDERLPLAATEPLPKFRVTKSERAKMFESDVPAAICEQLHTRTWSSEHALPFARLRGSELYDATTLLTVCVGAPAESTVKVSEPLIARALAMVVWPACCTTAEMVCVPLPRGVDGV